MQTARVPRFVIRLAKNCTARRNYLPEYEKGRPREYGKLVRPLARKRKEKAIPASSPDKTGAFTYQGRTILVHCWQNLVLTKHKVADQHETFDILVFFDPLYVDPLVLGTNVWNISRAMSTRVRFVLMQFTAHADRFLGSTPQKTPGRLRRVLAQADFPKEALANGQFRKKRSVTEHLPKGIAAHRRRKRHP